MMSSCNKLRYIKWIPRLNIKCCCLCYCEYRRGNISYVFSLELSLMKILSSAQALPIQHCCIWLISQGKISEHIFCNNVWTCMIYIGGWRIETDGVDLYQTLDARGIHCTRLYIQAYIGVVSIECELNAVDCCCCWSLLQNSFNNNNNNCTQE